MTPKLTDEMRAALDEHPGQPLAVEDERSHAWYVLIPAETYRSIAARAAEGGELDLRETYPLIDELMAADDAQDPWLASYQAEPQPPVKP